MPHSLGDRKVAITGWSATIHRFDGRSKTTMNTGSARKLGVSRDIQDGCMSEVRWQVVTIGLNRKNQLHPGVYR